MRYAPRPRDPATELSKGVNMLHTLKKIIDNNLCFSRRLATQVRASLRTYQRWVTTHARQRDSRGHPVLRWRHWRMMDLIRNELYSGSEVLDRVLICASRFIYRFGLGQWITAEECVNTIVERCLSGSRHWPHARKRTLIAFLCLVIKRTLINEAKKSGRSHLHESIEDDMESTHRLEYAIALSSRSCEQNVIAEDLERRFVQAITDPILRRYAELRLDDPSEPDAWYAAQLGVPVPEIQNFKKRLKRMADTWGFTPPRPKRGK